PSTTVVMRSFTRDQSPGLLTFCSRPDSRHSLEDNTDRDLHDARRPRRRHLSEELIHLVALRVESRRRVDTAELHLVEQVVDLPSELQAPAVCAERDVLEKRQIEIGQAGS